jgi:arylsulfatase A-like enzyme
MMEYAVDVMNRSPKPFFASIMTLSNHHPFHHAYPIPDPPASSDGRHDTLYRNYLRGVQYTDHGVGHFFREAADEEWFDDTIFVVTGDHGTMSFPGWLDRARQPAQERELFYRGVLAITGPGVPRKRLDVVASQVDVAPTVLDLLGIRAPNAFMGVSLLGDTPPGERFAVFASATEWSIRQADRYCYAIGKSCLADGWPACPEGSGPSPSAHACFTTPHDLLRVQDARVGSSMQLLAPDDADALSTRGERVTLFTNFLLHQDAIYPYPAEEADGM